MNPAGSFHPGAPELFGNTLPHAVDAAAPPIDAAPADALPPPPPPMVDAAQPMPDAPPVDAAPPPLRHARCGWIGPGDDVGVQTFVANVSYFDVVHPGWYYLAPDSVSVSAVAGTDDSRVMQSGVRVWPLVGAVGDVTNLRTMLNDPTKRAAHTQVLVTLAVSHGYAGLDIDYEGLWSASDRAPFEDFMQQVTTAMHAAGKQISAAVPALAYPVAGQAVDYSTLSAELDALHMMGYDYHYLGGDHQGPVAPLGWIDAACATAAATGRANRFILGIPNYGIGLNYSCAGVECDSACGGSYTTVDTHMASCPYGVYAAGRAPHCPYGGSMLYFDDLASQEEKVQTAHSHGLAGVTYWTVGREHAGWFDMVKRYY